MASNLSDNYEKVVLVLAILVAVGLGTMAYMNIGKLEGDFDTPGGRMQDAPKLPGVPQITTASANLTKPHEWDKGDVGDREVDMLTGIPWFLSKDEMKEVDLGNPNEEPVHPPIPNSWWLENNIDPGFKDSPQRDPDGDGFTNEEEYLAKTSPNDAKSFGERITKVELVKLIKEPYRLELSSESDGKYVVKYEDLFTGKQRRNRSDYIPAGDEQGSVFFKNLPAQFRFNLIKVERRKIENPRTKVMEEKLFATVEVLNGPKKGTQYEFARGNRNYIVRDYKVMLVLNATGEGGNQFEVLENDTFALPFDSDATEKPYKFKGVDENGSAVIEWQADGETKTKILSP